MPRKSRKCFDEYRRSITAKPAITRTGYGFRFYYSVFAYRHYHIGFPTGAQSPGRTGRHFYLTSTDDDKFGAYRRNSICHPPISKDTLIKINPVLNL